MALWLVFTELIKAESSLCPPISLRLITISHTCLLLFIAELLTVEGTFSNQQPCLNPMRVVRG